MYVMKILISISRQLVTLFPSLPTTSSPPCAHPYPPPLAAILIFICHRSSCVISALRLFEEDRIKLIFTVFTWMISKSSDVIVAALWTVFVWKCLRYCNLVLDGVFSVFIGKSVKLCRGVITVQKWIYSNRFLYSVVNLITA